MLLPSGYRVRGVIPGLAALAEKGLLDGRVQQAILRMAASVATTEVEAAEDDAWQTGIDAFVAGFPREAQDPGDEEWKAVHLDVVDLPNLDQRDRQALQSLVLRVRTAEEITRAVERGAEQDEEEPGSLDRLAEFRDEPDGAEDRSDGDDLARAPVRAAAGGG